MVKEILLNGVKIQYDFQYKKVKNINLRVRSDGTVRVSANRRVSQRIIEDFLLSESDFILNALERYKSKAENMRQYFSEDELRKVVTGLCEKAYLYYEKLGVKYPQIKFRRMVSRWGSCHPSKGVLTFNTNLMYAPPECIKYVVFHEFTHFLQANHSPEFYCELFKVCPDWKECRRRLREIYIK